VRVFGTLACSAALVACSASTVDSGGPAASTSTPATTVASPSPTCAAPTSVADLVPRAGTLFGVNLDWATQTLDEYATALGHAPAVAVSFAGLPMSDAEHGYVDAAVEQVAAHHGALMLTLEPHAGLAAVTPAVVADLTTRLAAYNARGVAVFLRYAHEMNGTWYAWGQQPQAYVASFRAVATAIHAGAPLTAMVWAPNYGGGYPFGGGKYEAPKGSAARAALDTNRDGVLDQRDDPYTPFYPGDAAVDWVGISLYHWGAHYPWGANSVPEKGKFLAMLRGTYHGTAGDERDVPDLYAFAGAHAKPLAVTETAAFYSPGHGGDELSIKRAWWTQVFDAVQGGTVPDLRMVNWFEWEKLEPEVKARVDWRASASPPIATPFRAALPAAFVYAGCTG
jgi:hypothetical protein